MKRLISIAAGLVLTGVAAAQTTEPAAPAAKTDDPMHPRVKMETSLGDIVLQLDGEKAPVSVFNFLRYCDDGFYVNTVFHRVIPTFMIQGGGYSPEMEEKKSGLRAGIFNEWKNGLKNERGTISMARLGGQPNSATAQFFINVVDNERLDRPQPDGAAYAVFGKVVEGMDVVDKIKAVELMSHPKYPSPSPVTPKEAVVIKSVKVVGACDTKQIEAKCKEVVAAADAEEAKAKAIRDMAIDDVVKKIEEEQKVKLTKHESGIWTAVLKEGDGASPKSTDTVSVHYTGWLVDGQKFDSSVDRGQPASFPLDKVIKGWTTGVGLMKVGEKRKLVIPPDLGYGQRGSPPVIPANAILIFDVELLGIAPPPGVGKP